MHRNSLLKRMQHNVEQAIRDLGITYPVAMDNQFAIWNAYHNQYWPAHYLIDAQGQIRDQHFGEGAYQETEQMIQTLLKEAHQGVLAVGDELVQVAGSGATAAAADMQRSPETYVGYARQQNLVSPEAVRKDATAQYSTPRKLEPNQWALSGKWQVSAEYAAVQASGGAISYRFQGRDLHLVLGTLNGKPVRFQGHAGWSCPWRGSRRGYRCARQRRDPRAAALPTHPAKRKICNSHIPH